MSKPAAAVKSSPTGRGPTCWPAQMSDAEKAAQLGEVRKLLGKARENSKRGTVIERKIHHALKTVRQGR